MPTKLGQNFLTNETTAKKIVDFSNLSSADNVLEIGPGEGILTKYLAKTVDRVLAIEIDKTLVISLNKAFQKQFFIQPYYKSGVGRDVNMVSGISNLKIVEGDILKINLPQLLKENNFKNYKVVANLPYYITSKIIRLFLETKYPPAEMTLMVQKEVGERICAPARHESILSVSVKFYANPEILFFVPRENFNPSPEVDSAVIRIERKNNIPKINTNDFFSLVRGGFCAKRKMIANNLSTTFHIPKAQLSETLKKAGIDPKKRAQELELQDWMKLCSQLKTKSEKRKAKNNN